MILFILLLISSTQRFDIDRVGYDEFVNMYFGDVYPVIAADIENQFDINDGRVLEIVFTAPYLSLDLANMTNAKFDILVEDSIEASITHKRISQRGLAERFSVQIGSIESIPFKDKTFDLVLTREALRFWQGNPKAYREINRVLKDSAWAYLGAGFGKSISEQEGNAVWDLVKEWREKTKPEPWATTKPVQSNIVAALKKAGVLKYQIWQEGDCPCRTMVTWCKSATQ